jgi:hypothetical protein
MKKFTKMDLGTKILTKLKFKVKTRIRVKVRFRVRGRDCLKPTLF